MSDRDISDVLRVKDGQAQGVCERCGWQPYCIRGAVAWCLKCHDAMPPSCEPKKGDKMKYKQLIEAFKNGTLERYDWELLFEKEEGGHWSYIGSPPDDLSKEGQEDYRELMEDEMVRKYGRPGGPMDLVELAKAAGIPADWI